MTKTLFQRLISKPYVGARYAPVTECSICLEEFSEQDPISYITPLPCRDTTLHIFHTSCIKSWLRKENKCPLCKEEVTSYGFDMLRDNFEDKYPEEKSELC